MDNTGEVCQLVATFSLLICLGAATTVDWVTYPIGPKRYSDIEILFEYKVAYFHGITKYLWISLYGDSDTWRFGHRNSGN